MTLNDGLLLVLRWIHAVVAVAWVGGNIFFYLVINPAIRRGNLPSQSARILGPGFYTLVDICIVVLLLTGVIMTVERLSSRFATTPYIIILGIKIGLALWMFALIRLRRPAARIILLEEENTDRPPSEHPITAKERLKAAFSSTNLLLTLGLIIFLLADLLRFLFEQEIEGR